MLPRLEVPSIPSLKRCQATPDPNPINRTRPKLILGRSHFQAIEDCAKNVTEFGRDGKKPRPVGTWSNNWGRGWAEDIDPIPCLVPSPVPTLIMDSPPSLILKALESLLHIRDGKKTHPVGTWSNNWGQGWEEDIFAIPWLVPSPVPTLIMDSWSWEPLKAYYILRDDKKYPFDGNRE